MLPQAVAKLWRDEYRIEPPRMRRVSRLRLTLHGKASKILMVPAGKLTLPLQDQVNLLELSDSYGRADIRHAVVVADCIVPILLRRRYGLRLEMVGLLVNVCAIADDHTAFAGGDRLVSKKAESCHFAECSDVPASIECPKGFGAILDQQQSVFGTDFGNCLHVAGSTVKMHHHHGFGTWGNCPLYG